MSALPAAAESPVKPGPRLRGCFALLALLLPVLALAQGRPPVDGAQLLAELRRGGYILYFRHTATLPEHRHEAGQREAGTLDVNDCATQRNLSELGYRQAREQAAWVAKLGIPIGEVLASRYCRTRLHAAWFSDSVRFDEALTPVRNAAKAAQLKRLLAAAPAPGANTFMFAHGGILWQATDYDSVEAETFVFRPAGADGAVLVAALKMEDWERLAAGLPCCAPRSFWSGKGTPPVE
jgi:phosphohistidine phosphatase SixA